MHRGNFGRGTASGSPDPAAVVEEIVQHINRCYARYPGEPFTPDERREAFSKLFSEICGLCFHPEWMPLCERILNWTFENKNDTISRSDRVAVLISSLMEQAGGLRTLRLEMFAQVLEMRKAIINPIQELDILELKLNGEEVNQGDLTSLVDRLEKAGHVTHSRQIESGLTKIAQMKRDIQEKLSQFASNIPLTPS